MAEENLTFDSFESPPFYGTGEMLTWSADALLASIDKKGLFTDHWHHGRQFENSAHTMTEEEMEIQLRALEMEIITDSLIDARGYYCFYPVIADNDELVILDPNDFHTELAALRFPRQADGQTRSLVDYFRPEMDILAVHIATLGPFIGDKCRQYTQQRDAKGFFLQGLSQVLLKVLLDKLDIEIHRSLFLPRDRGQRFSFGTSEMPEADQQQRLLEVVCAEDRLGITLTSENVLLPNFSAMCVYITHPAAKKIQ